MLTLTPSMRIMFLALIAALATGLVALRLKNDALAAQAAQAKAVTP